MHEARGVTCMSMPLPGCREIRKHSSLLTPSAPPICQRIRQLINPLIQLDVGHESCHIYGICKHCRKSGSDDHVYIRVLWICRVMDHRRITECTRQVQDAQCRHYTEVGITVAGGSESGSHLNCEAEREVGEQGGQGSNDIDLGQPHTNALPAAIAIGNEPSHLSHAQDSSSRQLLTSTEGCTFEYKPPKQGIHVKLICRQAETAAALA